MYAGKYCQFTLVNTLTSTMKITTPDMSWLWTNMVFFAQLYSGLSVFITISKKAVDYIN
jgi:hypothetical protein